MNKLTLNLLILLTIPCILYGRNFNVMDFGALGNGISDDAIAIQKAVDACTNAGGGDVVFSANHTFLSGPVQLKSNVNIVLETNSVWKANPDESIYHLSAFGKNEGEGMMWRIFRSLGMVRFMAMVSGLWVLNFLIVTNSNRSLLSIPVRTCLP